MYDLEITNKGHRSCTMCGKDDKSKLLHEKCYSMRNNDTQAPSMKLETGDSRVGEEDKYAQMASKRHVPCFIEQWGIEGCPLTKE